MWWLIVSLLSPTKWWLDGALGEGLATSCRLLLVVALDCRSVAKSRAYLRSLIGPHRCVDGAQVRHSPGRTTASMPRPILSGCRVTACQERSGCWSRGFPSVHPTLFISTRSDRVGVPWFFLRVSTITGAGRDRHRQAVLHQFLARSGLWRLDRVEVVGDIFGCGIECPKRKASGLVNACLATERLNHATTALGFVETPRPSRMNRTDRRAGADKNRRRNRRCIESSGRRGGGRPHNPGRSAACRSRPSVRGHLAVKDVAICRIDARCRRTASRTRCRRCGLVADRLDDVIAPQQRHRAAQRLQVVAPAAGGAGVDQHVRDAVAAARPSRPGSPDVADSR